MDRREVSEKNIWSKICKRKHRIDETIETAKIETYKHIVTVNYILNIIKLRLSVATHGHPTSTNYFFPMPIGPSLSLFLSPSGRLLLQPLSHDSFSPSPVAPLHSVVVSSVPRRLLASATKLLICVGFVIWALMAKDGILISELMAALLHGYAWRERWHLPLGGHDFLLLLCSIWRQQDLIITRCYSSWQNRGKERASGLNVVSAMRKCGKLMRNLKNSWSRCGVRRNHLCPWQICTQNW